MNASVGTSGLLVVLVGMSLATFPVISSAPNESYGACIASLPASYCQYKYNQDLLTAGFPYRIAGGVVAIAGLATFVAGLILGEEALPGGRTTRAHWALILMGGVAALAYSLLVLQTAGSATGSNASPGYMISLNDPYYQVILPAFGLALAGLILTLAGAIRLVEELLPREKP